MSIQCISFSRRLEKVGAPPRVLQEATERVACPLCAYLIDCIGFIDSLRGAKDVFFSFIYILHPVPTGTRTPNGILGADLGKAIARRSIVSRRNVASAVSLRAYDRPAFKADEPVASRMTLVV